MNNKAIFTGLILVLIGGLAFAVLYKPGGGTDKGSNAPVGFEVGNRAPDWTFNDADGVAHSLSDYLGKVVVLDFWATWCPPCRMVMPDLQKVHEKYQSRGVVVIGMDGAERGGDPVKYMKDNGFTYHLLLNTDTAMMKYAPNGIPQMYVIGVDGEILHKHVGYKPGVAEELGKVIEPHLESHGL